jgi:alpha-beta hydrolase superfamily lysophospholipase
MRRLGIVGHRELEPEAADFVCAESVTLLSTALAASGEVVALSALAEGADTLFAEAALSLLVPLEVVRPFSSYAEDFTRGPARRRYRALAAAARAETRLRFDARCERAYEAAMRWVVDNCDLLVAAWDGGPARGRGGTAEAVRHAVRIGRPVLRLDVTERVVRGLAA